MKGKGAAGGGKGPKGGTAIADPEEDVLEPEETAEEPEAEDVLETPEGDETDETGKETDADKDETDESGDEPEADPDADEEEDPRDATIAELRERLDKLEKGPDKKEEPKELSDADWQKIEDQFGISEKDGMPGTFGRQGIQQLFRLLAGQRQSLADMIQSEIGGFKKEAVISELAQEKGFEDIKGHRKGMDEFLKDYDPRIRADKQLLKKALIYARGMAASGKVKKALNSRERDRRIAAGGAHGKPGAKGLKKAVSLTPEQKQAAKMAKMPEAEYIKYLTTDNLEDIDLPE